MTLFVALLPCVLLPFLPAFNCFASTPLTVAYGGLPPAADETADVLILGAGAAGVSAARELHDKGVSFLLLEGREEIGGRMRHAKIGDLEVELGAWWVAGAVARCAGQNNNPMWDLAQAANMELKFTDWDDTIIFGEEAGGARVPWGQTRYREFATAVECLETQRETLAARVREGEREVDQSIRATWEACGWTPESSADYVLEWFDYDWDHFSTPSQTSTVATQYFEYWEQSWQVTDARGFKQTLHTLGSPFLDSEHSPLRLNTRVVTISRPSTGGVLVTAVGADGQEKTYGGRYAIVTFPLGVLTEGSVHFDPPLPEWKTSAFESMPMGTGLRLFLQFNTTFWDPAAYWLWVDTERGVWPAWQNLNVLVDGDAHTLVANQAGEIAVEAAAAPIEDTVADAMAVLRQIYPDAPEPVRVLRSEWKSDPWAYGSYPYFPTGTMKWSSRFIEYPVGQVFFAGDATEPYHWSTTTGAYYAGLRVAEMIIECDSPGSPTLSGAVCPAAEFNEEAVINAFFEERPAHLWGQPDPSPCPSPSPSPSPLPVARALVEDAEELE